MKDIDRCLHQIWTRFPFIKRSPPFSNERQPAMTCLLERRAFLPNPRVFAAHPRSTTHLRTAYTQARAPITAPIVDSSRFRSRFPRRTPRAFPLLVAPPTTPVLYSQKPDVPTSNESQFSTSPTRPTLFPWLSTDKALTFMITRAAVRPTYTQFFFIPVQPDIHSSPVLSPPENPVSVYFLCAQFTNLG